MRPRIGLLIAICVFSGCGSSGDTTPKSLPGRKTAALRAVGSLQDALNSGRCESVLDLAVEPLRAGKFAARDWPEQCATLRRHLGEWRSFDARRWDQPGRTILAVAGTVHFSNGDSIVQIVWDFSPIAPPSPALVAFFLRSGSLNIKLVPQLPGREPHYFDAPPVPTSPDAGHPG